MNISKAFRVKAIMGLSECVNIERTVNWMQDLSKATQEPCQVWSPLVFETRPLSLWERVSFLAPGFVLIPLCLCVLTGSMRIMRSVYCSRGNPRALSAASYTTNTDPLFPRKDLVSDYHIGVRLRMLGLCVCVCSFTVVHHRCPASLVQDACNLSAGWWRLLVFCHNRFGWQ